MSEVSKGGRPMKKWTQDFEKYLEVMSINELNAKGWGKNDLL